jgi:DNA-directed RNA polymerase subunit RPC12/RpoP
MKYVIVQITAVVKPIVKCKDCGSEIFGKSFTIVSDSRKLEQDIEKTLKTKVFHPVGWASYGVGVYRCPNCSI